MKLNILLIFCVEQEADTWQVLFTTDCTVVSRLVS